MYINKKSWTIIVRSKLLIFEISNPGCIYSYFKDSTGFIFAANNDCKPTENVTSPITEIPLIRKMRGLIETRYVNEVNQLSASQYEIGQAIRFAANTNSKNFFDRSEVTPIVVEPNTFLIPISFVRLCTESLVIPINPIHAMNIAKMDA